MDTIRKSCNAHIVGQVDDDVLLFTWVEFKADGTNVPHGAVVQKQVGLAFVNVKSKKISQQFVLKIEKVSEEILSTSSVIKISWVCH